jgi:carbamoyl-phosphate synthase large subunit
MRFAVKASPEHPVLVDRFLNDATEVDVDAISDGQRVVIGGVMEHIEEAGIHSGDSACSLPPYSLGRDVVDEIVESTRRLALELGVVGLMNVQYAVKGKDVYVLEVNPRASRTVPFVAKAIGRPLAKLAALVMSGKTLEELSFTREIWPRHFSVKEAVFPFLKFPGVDTVLGPEMKSTGEVMGIDSDFGRAYAKAQIEAGNPIPATGSLFVSVRDEDQGRIAAPLREFAEAGFRILATTGTAKALEAAGIAVETVAKVGEGSRDIVARIEAGEVDLVMNTVEADPRAVKDSFAIRRAALQRGLPYFTTFAAVRAAAGAVKALRQGTIGVRALQEVHRAA